MGIKERRSREKEYLRQEILDAARQLFLRNGYENVSMREIAAKIDYSPTTIYLYFRNKIELFHCLCEEAFGKLEQELKSIVGRPQEGTAVATDPVGSLRKGAGAYIRFGLNYPHHYRLLFLTPHPEGEDSEFQYKGSAGERSFQFLLGLISLGIEQGKFRKSDPMMLAQACWAVMHGITSLLITQNDFPWVEREAVIQGVVETLMRGIAA
jgi:AcrR family transcriptional regulator